MYKWARSMSRTRGSFFLNTYGIRSQEGKSSIAQQKQKRRQGRETQKPHDDRTLGSSRMWLRLKQAEDFIQHCHQLSYPGRSAYCNGYLQGRMIISRCIEVEEDRMTIRSTAAIMVLQSC